MPKMFEPTTSPRLFGLAPGVDFPAALVAGLKHRLRNAPPDAMARVTLIVNTERMQRRIRALFHEGGASFLPRIKLVTDLGDAALLADIAPSVSPLRRRLELVQLVTRFLDTQIDVAARSAIYDLTDSLAALMDEMQGEGVTPEDLANLDVTDQSGHWKRALDFLNIVHSYAEASSAAPDPEARRRLLVEFMITGWQASPPADPILIAGSTGSRGTTAMLMRAVSKLPQGALILPGFDFAMPRAAWVDLETALTSEDHPQYRFARLMTDLEIAPDQVLPWHDTAPANAARNAAVSLALRPAPVTNCWLSEGPNLASLETAFANVTLLQAASRREEALAIALRLRHAAEDGKTAALITPDRMLSREVTSALDRWNILPDDSAGTPLHLSPPGRFLRHVAALFLRKTPVSAMLELLKHPLCHSGGDRGQHLLLTRDLELHLRGQGPPYPDKAYLVAWAQTQKNAMAVAWANWVGDALCRPVPALQSLHDHVHLHLELAQVLSQGATTSEPGGLWEKKAGIKAHEVLQALAENAHFVPEIRTSDYAALVQSVLQAETLRDRDAPHPNILIWGTLEARVQGADILILGGLNEGSWPEMPSPDPWLNRKMRNDAGLLLPERRVGLSAHDFQQAVAAPEVWITRSVRSDDAETVPSRWLNRLTNLLRGLPAQNGPEVVESMIARGQRWLDQVQALEQVTQTDPAARPSPRPPVTARPQKLYVTAIPKLVRDPFAIYAKNILKLRPLNPLDQAPDALLRGIVLHSLLENFIKAVKDDPSQLTKDALTKMAQAHLQEHVPWPSARALWQARVDRMADWFIQTEQERQARGTPVAFEATGAAHMTDPPFTLAGRADRLDLDERGGLRIYDYKSGNPPNPTQQLAFDRQLLLLAAIADQNGFEGISPRHVAEATFIGVGSAPKEVGAPLAKADPGQTWAEFSELIRAYYSPKQGYTARLAAFKDDLISDYDHLSRYGEWDATQDPKPEDLT